MGERLIGKLPDNKAQICVSLACPMYLDKPYEMCQVKAAIKTRGDDRPRILRDYKSNIPKGCALGYDKEQAAAEPKGIRFIR